MVEYMEFWILVNPKHIFSRRWSTGVLKSVSLQPLPFNDEVAPMRILIARPKTCLDWQRWEVVRSLTLPHFFAQSKAISIIHPFSSARSFCWSISPKARQEIRQVCAMRWGLVPSFAKNEEEYNAFKGGNSTFNARIEGAFLARKCVRFVAADLTMPCSIWKTVQSSSLLRLERLENVGKVLKPEISGDGFWTSAAASYSLMASMNGRPGRLEWNSVVNLFK